MYSEHALLATVLNVFDWGLLEELGGVGPEAMVCVCMPTRMYALMCQQDVVYMAYDLLFDEGEREEAHEQLLDFLSAKAPYFNNLTVRPGQALYDFYDDEDLKM